MELSFSDLRQKDVVNVSDGENYGKISDMIIDSSGKNVLGLVVPVQKRFLRPNDELFVPWCSISKIGKDVILVQVNGKSQSLAEVKACSNANSDDFLS